MIRISAHQLIEAVEHAVRHDPELDAHVCCLVFASASACVEQSPFNFNWCVYDGVDRSGRPRLFHKERVLPYTKSIEAALTLLPPGFWWRGGTCCVSSEARVCPDHNDPQHRERLLRDYPPSVPHWNEGIEVEIRPGSESALARAITSACLRVRFSHPAAREAMSA